MNHYTLFEKFSRFMFRQSNALHGIRITPSAPCMIATHQTTDQSAVSLLVEHKPESSVPSAAYFHGGLKCLSLSQLLRFSPLLFFWGTVWSWGNEIPHFVAWAYIRFRLRTAHTCSGGCAVSKNSRGMTWDIKRCWLASLQSLG